MLKGSFDLHRCLYYKTKILLPNYLPQHLFSASVSVLVINKKNAFSLVYFVTLRHERCTAWKIWKYAAGFWLKPSQRTPLSNKSNLNDYWNGNKWIDWASATPRWPKELWVCNLCFLSEISQWSLFDWYWEKSSAGRNRLTKQGRSSPWVLGEKATTTLSAPASVFLSVCSFVAESLLHQYHPREHTEGLFCMLHGKMFLSEELENDGGTVKKRKKKKEKKMINEGNNKSLKVGIPEGGMEEKDEKDLLNKITKPHLRQNSPSLSVHCVEALKQEIFLALKSFPQKFRVCFTSIQESWTLRSSRKLPDGVHRPLWQKAHFLQSLLW